MHAIWQGRKLVWGMTLAGVFLLFDALAGLLADGVFPRVGAAVAGLGLLIGAGGALGLSYEMLGEEDIFPIKIAIRAGFMMVGPGFVIMELPRIWSDINWILCLAGCAATMVPFGVSLLMLIMREKQKRNSDT